MSSQTEFITRGTANVSIDVMLVQDNSGTNPGDPITGLVWNSSGLKCYYREGNGALTQLTLATLASATAAHADGGFVEISSTNAPGLYRLDLSDTIVDGAANKASVVISGYADLAPHFINIVLMDFDWFDTSPNVTMADTAAGAITATSLASDTITAAKIATNAFTSDALDSSYVTEMWAKVVESQGSYTAQQVLSILLAVNAGETNTGGTVFRTPNDAATRVTATLDASNNRTNMTLNPSS